MKKAILATALLTTAISANAFTIQKQAEANSYQYNEILDRHIPNDVSLWTGINDNNKGYLKISLDGGLHRFDIEMEKDSKDINEWQHMLDKTVEWANVAKKNKVDVSKNFREDNVLNCSNSVYHCGASFIAHSDGKHSYMYLYIQEKDNEFIKFDGKILLDDVQKLKTAFDKREEYWNLRKATLQKTSNLNKDELFK